MDFIVYVPIGEGSRTKVIAKAKYEEDARAVLSNWHSGYITDREGYLIYSKLYSKLS